MNKRMPEIVLAATAVSAHETMEQMLSVAQTEMLVREEIASRISTYQATPEDIERWWSTNDPLSETEYFAFASSHERVTGDHSTYHDTYNYYSEIYVDALKGGVNMVSHVLFGLNASELSHLAGLRQDVEPGGAKDRIDIINVVRFLNTSLLGKDSYTISELNRLGLAKELLEISYRFLDGALKQDGNQIGGMNEEQSADFMKSMLDLIGNSHSRLTAAAEVTEATCIEQNRPLIECDEMRLIGLSTKLKRVALYEATTEEHYAELDRSINQEARDKLLLEYIDSLQILFDNPESTMWQRLKRSHIKGPLHEALWFLDTAILKRAYPERYSQLIILPSPQNADKPTVGKPTWNRSYDYTIENGNQDMHFFQLKSAPQKNLKHKKDYHPAINILEEENFMEINPSRLRAKLRAYRQVIENGSKPEEAEQALEKFVMPTAYQAIEIAIQDVDSRQKQMKELLKRHYFPELAENHQGPKPNRQQRRAMAKKDKKQKRY